MSSSHANWHAPESEWRAARPCEGGSPVACTEVARELMGETGASSLRGRLFYPIFNRYSGDVWPHQRAMPPRELPRRYADALDERLLGVSEGRLRLLLPVGRVRRPR